jgi:hypothetical protein
MMSQLDPNHSTVSRSRSQYMKEDIAPSTPVLWMAEEHAELTRRLAALRKWWMELDQFGMPKFGEMGSQLENLRDILAEHFSTEEKGGYLAPALAVAPHLSRQVNELQSQHGQLLESLNGFINRLQMSEPPFESWQAAYCELETILADLRRHEREENKTVQAAFGNDLAAAD